MKSVQLSMEKELIALLLSLVYCDGRIDYETFVKHAKKFIALSDTLFDTWTIQQHSEDQIYLVKHQFANNSKYESGPSLGF